MSIDQINKLSDKSTNKNKKIDCDSSFELLKISND